MPRRTGRRLQEQARRGVSDGHQGGDAWESGLARLQDYAQREGHARIPKSYREDDGYGLGNWAQTQRTQHAQGVLADDRAARLAALPGWSWDPNAGAWGNGFARLQEFVQREGHARVLTRHRESDGYYLGEWAGIQRHLHRRGMLPAERAARLAALPGWNWCPSRSEQAWETGFARLQDFVQREGHARVPTRHRDSDGYHLGTWAAVQRHLHRRGMLPAERAARLAALPGWNWDARAGAWENGFEHLQRYAQREGHARVPTRHLEADGYPLGPWVWRERRSHQQGTLPAERAARLAALPCWSRDPRAEAWEDGFTHLQCFAQREGHTQVPASHLEADGYPLGQWVWAQRRSHQQGTLTAERAARLTALPGWSRDPRAEAWEDGFTHLQCFAQREGHTEVPASHLEADGYPLGDWVRRERRSHQRGRPPAERASKLAALPGWNLGGGDAWEEGFARLQHFVLREGHARVPATRYDSDDYPVGQWVRAQRHYHRQGTLPAERAARLTALPGWSWDPRGEAWEEAFARLQRYAQREDISGLRISYRDEDGYGLGRWVHAQHEKHARGVLTDDRARRLEALPGWAWADADREKPLWRTGSDQWTTAPYGMTVTRADSLWGVGQRSRRCARPGSGRPLRRVTLLGAHDGDRGRREPEPVCGLGLAGETSSAAGLLAAAVVRHVL